MPAFAREDAAEVDFVSTGTELTRWLEAHKNRGGMVQLTDDVVLEGIYYYKPSVYAPVWVDTAGYTITVAGEVEFEGGSQLIFLGQPKPKGFLYVAEGGFLAFSDVTVESEGAGCALWQEEGACLSVKNCCLMGDVHYAYSPYVRYKESVCVIVEKGQRVEDVLPEEIECTVNYQGHISNKEPMAVCWNLEGTELSQEARQRFQVQGVYTTGTAQEAPVCTVVYNDYPLTFMDVKASESRGFYSFLGSYTKPEEYLPIVIRSEYSFDGENWIVYDESNVSDSKTPNTFYIGIKHDEWDTEVYPSIFLRLQGSYAGRQYFSNVISFTTDNLEAAEDHGGSRGGGTSIVNPSDEPEKVPEGVTSDQERPSEGNAPENEQPPEEKAPKNELLPEEKAQENEQLPEGNAPENEQAPEENAPEDEQSSEEQVQESGQPIEEKPGGDTAGSAALPVSSQPDNAVSNAEVSAFIQKDNIGSDSDGIDIQERAAVTENENNTGNFVAQSDNIKAAGTQKTDRDIAVIVIFIMASGIAGAAGFGIHTGLLRRLFQRVGKIWLK